MSYDSSAIIETVQIQLISDEDLMMDKDILLMIEKLESMEVIIAHHDKIMSDMNEVILSQWKRIDAVEKKLLQLHEDINCMNGGQELRDQRPPHY